MKKPSKKLVAMVIALIMTMPILGLTACANSNEPHESARSTYVDEHNAENQDNSSNAVPEGTEWEFVAKGTLPSSANRFIIYRDTKTDVIWVLQNSWYGDGGSSFEPRVNPDGTYMTYQQYLGNENFNQPVNVKS